MEVPSQEVKGVAESVFGKTWTQILVAVIILGAAITALNGAITGTEELYQRAVKTVPSSVPPWAVTTVAIALFLFALAYVYRELRDARVLRGRVESIEKLITAQMEHHDESQDDRFSTLSKRVDYLESQVGDELLHVLADQQLESKGLSLGKVQREVKQIPQHDTKKEKERIEKAKKMLFAAAELARAFGVPEDFGLLSSQKRVLDDITNLITEGYSFTLFQVVENHRAKREREYKARNEQVDLGRILGEIAGILEKCVANFKPDDLGEDFDSLPDTFEAFTRG